MTAPAADAVRAIPAAPPGWGQRLCDPTEKTLAVLQALPWIAQARDALSTAQSRPLSPDYPQVSDTIRTATNAVLARTKTPERAAAEIGSRLGRVMR